MTVDPSPSVVVVRRIEAPASVIFGVLSNPSRHVELDGSGMLRGALPGPPISGVGDVFVMRMYYSELGDYEMNNHVVEYEQDRRIGWEPEAGRGHPEAEAQKNGGRWGHRWRYELTPDGSGATIVKETYDCSRVPERARASTDNGNIWRESMAQTLQRLDQVCTQEATR